MGPAGSSGTALSASGGGAGDASSAGFADEWVQQIHFEEIDSTQSYVEREHERFDQAQLTAVSADFQTAGRGTRDRTWEAVGGKSVLVTFFFRFPAELPTPFVNRNAPNVTKVLALSAVDSLRWAAGANPHPDPSLAFGLKWPNDVVANGQKIGGVLARAVLTGGRLDGVIVGVGVNINQSRAEMDLIKRPVWPATSLRALVDDDKTFDVTAVRKRLVSRFAEELRGFFAAGFPAYRERINGLEVLMGTEVRFRVSEQEVVEGTFSGVDEDGHIVLQLPGGATRSFPSGEIVPPTPAAGSA